MPTIYSKITSHNAVYFTIQGIRLPNSITWHWSAAVDQLWPDIILLASQFISLSTWIDG